MAALRGSDDGTWILGETEDITRHYRLGPNLGTPGQFGRAVKATRLHPKQGDEVEVAIKIISKTRWAANPARAQEQFGAFRKEIEVMRALTHPNLIRFYEFFEDRQQFYIVMELCTGGELFDRITAARQFSEREAAHVLRMILQGVAYMHERKIGHFDLKPDNFVFKDPSPNSQLKIIDFGMSQHLERRKYLKKFCGTPYYVAPEVIRGQYDEASDMWSIGVILFVMLHGYPPFYADPAKYGKNADAKVYQLIQAGFSPEVKAGYGAHFPQTNVVSAPARSLIARLLTLDHKYRLTAREALEDPWVSGEAAVSTPIEPAILSSLRQFNGTAKFKSAVINLMTGSLSDPEVEKLKATFTAMDADRNGVISVAELSQAMRTLDNNIHRDEIERIMRAADANNDGVLSYQELMATYVQKKLNAREERLWDSFCRLDQNRDGRITADEIRSVLGLHERPGVVEDLIREVDRNHDGFIDYAEFLALFMKDEEEVFQLGKVTQSPSVTFGK